MKSKLNFIVGIVTIAVVLMVVAAIANKGTDTFKIVGGEPSEQVNDANYFDEAISHRGEQMLVLPQDIVSTGRDTEDVSVIREPKLISVEDADATNYIFDDHYGLSLFDGAQYRYYPLSVLAWHEMAVDQVGETQVLISYSPLTDSFVPFVIENGTDFEYSGFVWNNNSLLLDKSSGTLYSQILKRGVYGEGAGKALEVYPHGVLSWNEWKIAHPDGMVLSGDENSSIPYAVSPYGPYLTSKALSFPLAHDSNPGRRPKNALFTLTTDAGAKAYDIAPIIQEDNGVKDDTFGGKSFALWIDDAGELHANERGDERFISFENGDLISSDGRRWTFDPVDYSLRNGEEVREYAHLERIFWFAWASTYPNTEIYGEVLGQGLIDGVFITNESDVVDDDAIRVEVDEGGFDITDIEVN